MDLSPARNHVSPSRIPNAKPRVSFIYQNQNTHLRNAEPLTPLRISNKENPNPPPNSTVESKVSQTPTSAMRVLFPSNLSNVMNARKDEGKQKVREKGENLQKYPPLTPKSNKKSSNSSAVPSFLINKQKQGKKEDREKEKDNEKQNIHRRHQSELLHSPESTIIDFNDACKCGKVSTYSDLKEVEKYCTKCGVEKMLGGGEIKAYASPRKSKNESGYQSSIFNLSSFLGNSMIKQPPREMQVEQLLKEIEEEKKVLSKKLEDSKQEDKNIQSYFKNKKVELKTHYEKIKAAIKESIEQDLKELAEREKEQIEEWQHSRKNIEEDLLKMSKIEQELKPQFQKLITEIDEQKYSSLINRSRLEMSTINGDETFNYSCLENGSKLTQVTESNFYKPEMFRKYKKSTFDISFKNSKVTVGQGQEDGKVRPKTKSEGILFSFEHKK